MHEALDNSKLNFNQDSLLFWYIFLVFGLPALGYGEWSFSWLFLGFIYLFANKTGQE